QRGTLGGETQTERRQRALVLVQAVGGGAAEPLGAGAQPGLAGGDALQDRVLGVGESRGNRGGQRVAGGAERVEKRARALPFRRRERARGLAAVDQERDVEIVRVVLRERPVERTGAESLQQDVGLLLLDDVEDVG